MGKIRLLRIGLLPRVIIAIMLGVALGNVFSEGWVRVFITFNALFSQFLGFMIPLIIIGLVTPAIGDIGRGAGKLLLITVVLAYGDTVLSGLLAYGTGSWLFPDMVASTPHLGPVKKAAELIPYFTISVPAFIDVMSALVLSFILGLTISYASLPTLKKVFDDFKESVSLTIGKVIIPLLPLYIFGIFLNMTYSGQAYRILIVFAQIIAVIFVLHLLVLLYEFCVAGIVVHRNPLRMLFTMLPAYMTALGTSSSAATIPVTLRCTLKNRVSGGVAGFVIPLCATIHMSGSCMKITACALTVCLLEGMPHDPLLFINFILMLSIMMVAGPGVPGGAVMAALAPLGSILGFGSNEQALIIALYIAMDSFGTACNVTGDGAIALVVDKLKK
ncbi:MAG: dicarboxylate/amino acid:cation symporter [Prevotellaceae bacterium]|nr:dicarboxylate/amino acid:cation symporter [Prevotellaceae bacterium]MBF1079389.1 dicarboxylate/amino acid:cation symporter [Prevotellaceae bacterium]